MSHIVLPQHPATPPLGTHPRELKSRAHTKTCTQMFTIILFTKAPNEKQPGCPASSKRVNARTPSYTTRQWKGTNKGHAQPPGWTFGEHCRVRKTSPKRLITERFHVCNSLEMTKFWRGRTQQLPGMTDGGGDRREVGVALNGQGEGSLWWNCCTAWLNQYRHPGYDTRLDFTTGENWVKDTRDPSALFLKTASKSLIRSIKIKKLIGEEDL